MSNPVLPTLITEINGAYQFQRPLSKQEIIDIALNLQFKNLKTLAVMKNPAQVKRYFQLRLSENKNEVFSVMFLTSKHQVIDCVDMFAGSIDTAFVPLRPIVQKVLQINAAAIIVAHNHPSGIPEPSQADRALTNAIQDALALISTTLLDHIIVGDGCAVSLAEQGVL